MVSGSSLLLVLDTYTLNSVHYPKNLKRSSNSTRALRKFKKSALNDSSTKQKQLVFKSYTVESTETFEKEFSRNHKDKKEWLLRTTEKLEQKPQAGKPQRGKLHGLW